MNRPRRGLLVPDHPSLSTSTVHSQRSSPELRICMAGKRPPSQVRRVTDSSASVGPAERFACTSRQTRCHTLAALAVGAWPYRPLESRRAPFQRPALSKIAGPSPQLSKLRVKRPERTVHLTTP